MGRMAWACGVVAGLMAIGAGEARAQAPAGMVSGYVLKCGNLIDGKGGGARRNVEIVIQGTTIREVRGGRGGAEGGMAVVDLSKETCLPGLIDTHTHVLLQGDITAADYDEQVLKESPAYRALRASAADGGIEPVVEIHERVGRPELLANLLARDQFAGALQQHDQDREWLVLQFDTDAVLTDLARTGIHLVGAEPDHRRFGGRGGHRTGAECTTFSCRRSTL